MIKFNQEVEIKPGKVVSNLAIRNSVNRIDPVHKVMVIFYDTFLNDAQKGFLPRLCGAIELQGEEFEEFYATWTSTLQLYQEILPRIHDMWAGAGIHFDMEKCVIDDEGEVG